MRLFWFLLLIGALVLIGAYLGRSSRRKKKRA